MTGPILATPETVARVCDADHRHQCPVARKLARELHLLDPAHLHLPTRSKP